VKARSMAVQGGLAAAGLLAAYVTWQRPPESQKAETASILSATKQSLEKVRFDDGTRFVELKKVTDSEPRLWVSLGYLEGKRPVYDAGVPAMDPDAGVSRMPVSPPPEPPPNRTALAAERADSLFGRFTPFEATRALGALPKEKLEELGLIGSERHLEVTVAGQAHRYLVSKPQHGLIGSYVQDGTSNEVFLVQSSMFSELDPGSQLLVDRRLHTFKSSDFDHFMVSTEGKGAEYVQTDAVSPGTAKVAKASQPDKADDMAKNWHEKIWTRLIVTEVLGKDELPKAGEPKVRVRIDYQAKGSSKGFLELAVDGQKGTWARSENTASWVGLHQGAEELIDEAKKLVE
jgi:hypothetical protein